jgi:hypothetical protein
LTPNNGDTILATKLKGKWSTSLKAARTGIFAEATSVLLIGRRPLQAILIRFNTSTGSRHSTPVDLGPQVGPVLGMDVSADGWFTPAPIPLKAMSWSSRIFH